MLVSFQISCEWFEKMLDACDHRFGVDDGRRLFLHHAGDGGLHRRSGADESAAGRGRLAAAAERAAAGAARRPGLSQVQRRRLFQVQRSFAFKNDSLRF